MMPLERIHVLVLDDDERERRFLRDALESWGAIVTASAAVEAAHVALRADVIVYDLETMEAAGDAVVQELWRAQLQNAPVPTVTLLPSGRSLAGRALQTELYRRLTKPVNATDLQMTVSVLTRTSPSTETGPHRDAGVPPGAVGPRRPAARAIRNRSID